tara:strand:+ start:408 stop:635 length:228 start_codon:yes stop_codon:yes gene_type:complete
MNIYIFSLLLSFIFIILKILINKYVEKKNKPIKPILKDSILIFLISIVSNYIYINFIQNNLESPEVNVFTDKPEF